VAVAGGALDRVDADVAVGAGTVVHDGALAVFILQAGAQQAGQHVHGAARRERGDDAERAVLERGLGGGVVGRGSLGERSRGDRREQRAGNQASASLKHDELLLHDGKSRAFGA